MKRAVMEFARVNPRAVLTSSPAEMFERGGEQSAREPAVPVFMQNAGAADQVVLCAGIGRSNEAPMIRLR